MAVFNLNSLPKAKRIQMIAEFYDTINALSDRGEVRLFFKDLLTANEIATLMRRMEIAVLLSVGFTYKDIVKMIGVGTTKIASVQKALLQDGNGYQLAIERLLKNRKKRLKKIKDSEKDLTPYQRFKKVYSGHFALVNLINEFAEELEDDPDKKKEAALFTPSLR